MYTIIAGTNRLGSNSLKVAREYQRILSEKGIQATVFSLVGVDVMNRDAAFEKIENEIIIPSQNLIFIIPEYNGSFPGVLKMLFDTSKSNTMWWHKKALVVGVASGRAGNLRGIDHLTSILNYLKITVQPNQLPISSIDKLLDEHEKIKDEPTLKVINRQLDEFIHWVGCELV